MKNIVEQALEIIETKTKYQQLQLHCDQFELRSVFELEQTLIEDTNFYKTYLHHPYYYDLSIECSKDRTTLLIFDKRIRVDDEYQAIEVMFEITNKLK